MDTQAETNKALVRRFFEEIFNKRNLDSIEDFVAPGFVNHNNPTSIATPGPVGVRETLLKAFASYSDFNSTILDLIAEEDKVAVRGIDHFTYLSEDKPTTVNWIEIIRLENGKAVEAWAVEQMVES
jgi:predicted SnoaL-like aldol condensation-catalyzing enzyme